MVSDLPALQAAPFEFQKAPFPECLLAPLMLEWPLNSFEPKLQPLEGKNLRSYKKQETLANKVLTNRTSSRSQRT